MPMSRRGVAANVLRAAEAGVAGLSVGGFDGGAATSRFYDFRPAPSPA